MNIWLEVVVQRIEFFLVPYLICCSKFKLWLKTMTFGSTVYFSLFSAKVGGFFGNDDTRFSKVLQKFPTSTIPVQRSEKRQWLLRDRDRLEDVRAVVQQRSSFGGGSDRFNGACLLQRRYNSLAEL